MLRFVDRATSLTGVREMYGAAARDQYRSPFGSLFAQSQVLYDCNRMSGFLPTDQFGYMGAAFPAYVPERDRFRPERDELSEVMAVLRSRFSRRRLFRVADVADAVATVRRQRRRVDDDGSTTDTRPPPLTVRRLGVDMFVD